MSVKLDRSHLWRKVGWGFLFNTQADALIIQIYSVIKLYMFRASSILTLFGSGHQTCMKHTCTEYTVENS